uniref:Autophagy-related protein 9 n=1 Tax=Ganoderma boninense TaxID=34458 RepID=A0A5K1K2V2_9APHY|nr:Autophagy-related protein 9 [Ganoderma boninense]
MPLPSTRNIVIENLWSRWLTHSGLNIQTTLLEGKTNGIFNPGDNIDINLFQWLWSQIVQIELNGFTAYWNSHRVRKQKDKLMPSGSTPNDFFATPEQWGGQDCGIPVDLTVVEALRKELKMPHEDVYKFVSDDFRQMAEDAYASIGFPPLTLRSGWAVFAQMKAVLSTVYTWLERFYHVYDAGNQAVGIVLTEHTFSQDN